MFKVLEPHFPWFLSYLVIYFCVFYGFLFFAYSLGELAYTCFKRHIHIFIGVLSYCAVIALVANLGFYQALLYLIAIAGMLTSAYAAFASFQYRNQIQSGSGKFITILFAGAAIVWLIPLWPFFHKDSVLLADRLKAQGVVLSCSLMLGILAQLVYLFIKIKALLIQSTEITKDSPFAAFVLELDVHHKSRLRFVSNRFLTLTGLNQDELLSHIDFFGLIHPDDKSSFLAMLNDSSLNKSAFAWEGRMQRDEGLVWIRLEMMPMGRSNLGSKYQGIITDITMQKVSEAELQALQQETQQILKELPIPLIWSSLKEDGITLFVNTRFTEVFGYTLADIPKTEDWMIRAYPDRSYRSVVLAWWRTRVAQAIKDKSSIPSRELKMLTKDGKMLDVLMRATIVEGLLSVSFLDITDRKMAEGLALTLTENIPVGTYVMEVKSDGSSRLNFVSKRFIQLFGIQASAAKANPNLVFEKIHPEDYEEFMVLHTKALQEKKRFYQEVRVIIRNKAHWFSFEAVPRTTLDDLMIWEGVTADITDRKEAERLSTQQAMDIFATQQELLRLKQVEELNASLKKTIEEKNLLLKSSTTVFKANSMGNMMRSVAHEINNPLGAISLNTELLELEVQALKDRLPENEHRRMDDLVKAILSDGKRAGGVVTRLRKLFVYGEDNYAVFNLSDLVADITHILQNELMEHDITLKAEIVPHCEMYGDNGQIQMVVLNALNNAIYAIKERAIPKNINLRLSQTDTEICIECEDNGPGFPEDFIKKGPGIFQTSKKEGMGVGLWLSKTIVENHHGTLEIQNRVHGGAMLLIRLPQAKVMQNKTQNER